MLFRSPRHWIAFEQEHQYLAASAFRFLEKNTSKENAWPLYTKLIDFRETLNIETTNIVIETQQTLPIIEEPAENRREEPSLQLGLFEI